MLELLIILAVLLVLLAALGIFLLCFACLRGRKDDLWDGAVLDRRGYGMLKKTVAESRDWFLTQTVHRLQIFSYDAKRLCGLLVPAENARGTIILFHGWRSGWKLDFSSIMKYYHDKGLNLILVDQRSHGESRGTFITFGVKESRDVVSWVTYAGQMFGPEHPIFLGGISMGASTVLMAADEEMPENIRGIIADCGFTNAYEEFESVVRRTGRKLPVRFLLALMNVFTKIFAGFGLKDKSTDEAVKYTSYPILFVHGTADSFVPCGMTQRTYEACVSDKELVLVEGAVHGMSYSTDPQRVTAALDAFIERNLGGV